MQIPQHLQHYSKPTIVVIGDFEHAKIYLAHDEVIDEVEKVKAPEQKEPENEGAVSLGLGRIQNLSSEIDIGVRRGQFTQSLTERLTKMLRDRDASSIKLVMPTEACRRVQENLPKEFKDAVVKVLNEDLIYLPLIEVLERLAK